MPDSPPIPDAPDLEGLATVLARMEDWATAFDGGRERSEDDHPEIKRMHRCADDIRLVVAGAREAGRYKAALERIASYGLRPANGSNDGACIDVLQGAEAIKHARAALNPEPPK